MTERDALLAAVLADPAADLPRLVYADYLDDYGDALERARAELIRTQIELTRAEPDSLHYLALRSVERRLLDLHTKDWLRPLRMKGEPFQNSGAHGQFRRGFVEVVWMPALVYARRAEKLLARVPVRELRLTMANLDGLALALAHPATAKLPGLELSGLQLGDAAAFQLVESAAWRQSLEVVRLRACNLTAAAAGAMVESPAPKLRELDLAENAIPPEWLARLRGHYGPGAVRA